MSLLIAVIYLKIDVFSCTNRTLRFDYCVTECDSVHQRHSDNEAQFSQNHTLVSVWWNMNVLEAVRCAVKLCRKLFELNEAPAEALQELKRGLQFLLEWSCKQACNKQKLTLHSIFWHAPVQMLNYGSPRLQKLSWHSQGRCLRNTVNALIWAQGVSLPSSRFYDSNQHRKSEFFFKVFHSKTNLTCLCNVKKMLKLFLLLSSDLN